MNRREFNQYIQEANFQELFVTEMGWNNPKGYTDIIVPHIDNVDYEMETIAERNGFQILICQVEKIPTASTCKKIDIKLRQQAHDYICIYVEKRHHGGENGALHHQWVAPVNKVEKRDIVTIEYTNIQQAEFLYTKIDGLSFDLDEETTIVDVKQRIQGTFMVNSEKITKNFYAGFKKEHTQFVKFIHGINDDITDDKKNKEKQWYASVMLNRLMFCYFIQKKGFLDMNENYLRDKLNHIQKERGENEFFQSFYKGFLVHLFHEGLNGHQHDYTFEQKYGRIPYLNGGMFDFHDIEKMFHNIDIDDEAFLHLFDFFDKWRWHLDTRITASGNDINPDVLGYIFEQYINDRAQMGAYYTKEDITEYIGKNCILPFLFDAVKKTTSCKDFKENGYVWQTLKQSENRYIYDAVKQGYTPNWLSFIPSDIAEGVDTTQPQLIERRSHWNERTPEPFNLPTEIWRETIERFQRCDELLAKISSGEIHEINDFITYNLDIRQFTYDLLMQTSDHLLIEHFYHAMQRVTILDPTCGSGAFLFAAMNILEPLYEVCITRMEEFHQQNKNLFVAELEEISKKYRSNIQYFIYKSIILRNLYGVDIMEEAVEIAKLRLFLKMVAVVEVNPRLDNLGLDPLPDIDFNIRCGNTLVGYATETELDNDLNYGDMFAKQEFKADVELKMDVVARAYDQFKDLQLTSQEETSEFKESKLTLKEKLGELNETLNKKLYSSTANQANGGKAGLTYQAWLNSHQPFHWLAEYYQIMHGNGGFDVIIGNPPYVVYNAKKYYYKISDSYKTYKCANLYAYCLERGHQILSNKGIFGIIVPNSSISATKMLPVQDIIKKGKICWISNYSWRPAKLFEGADMLLAIIIDRNSKQECIYSTKYNKWYNDYRTSLFKNIKYNTANLTNIEGSIAKIPSLFFLNIIRKLNSVDGKNLLGNNFQQTPTSYVLYYFRAVQYWFKVLDRIPIYRDNGKECITGEMKPIYAKDEEEKYAIIAILSSSLFFTNYIMWSSCQVVNSRDFQFAFNIKSLTEIELNTIAKLGKQLQYDYQSHSQLKERTYSKKGRIFTMEKQHFFIKDSKPIIDEIDKLLAKHYGFTEEELDFIINYDIKYRMGDELNKEEDE